MNRSSTSGLLLLLIGSLGLIGFLTGQLDRWLAWLFAPPGTAAVPTSLSAPLTSGSTASANRRSTA